MNNPCVAHRGFSGKAPENTLAAVRMAIALPFVSWMEIDVQLTKDGVPVVIHDFSLDRTTNGHGKVKNMDFEHMRRLDAGSWKGRAFRGEKVPSLEEVLNLAAGRLRLNIELKTSGDMYPGLEKAVIDLVNSKGMREEVVLTSFDAGVLQRIKELDPRIHTGLIYDSRYGDPARKLHELGCSLLSISFDRLSPVLAKSLADKGVKIMAWTVNKGKEMRRLSAMHSEIMICTNRPDIWGELFLQG
ncbi:glycerophosphodiester phosphodiesterase family protein [Paenibacillus sp. MMS20-IR301]|uniref:glycerophosphodiester phosphodiesterase n=1 Tax=Paenibacillus sp. MMS20-IR301 TaxID=2895946 RepID=UPI0028E2988E|nr:glycerophosphodiester phosphodiesterase family protein [Paenibacillus sp. MMS20-IR301]WNS46919.1 glycerophosphodiester phosphodiesterase family protein [Paenibacillus sp. MMS20-IR301]